MQDAALVGMMDGPGERLDQLGRRPRLLGRAREPPVETAAVHVFERQVIHAVLAADFMDLHDVGVLQAGHGFRLGAEAGHLLGGRVDAVPDDLQGHQAFQVGLLRQVDHSHAPVSQLADHGVLADARRQGVRSVSVRLRRQGGGRVRCGLVGRRRPGPAVRPSRTC